MAVDMFLKLDGIDGESRDHKHKGEIELLSFSWGISNTTAAGGGGGGAGKVQVQDFSFVKQIDKATPHLLEACCTGKHIGSAQITLASGRERPQEYLKIKMTDILISGFQTGGSNTGGAVPVEQVSFSFRDVDVQTTDRNGQWVSQASCNFGGKFPDGNIGHEHDK